MLDLLFPADLCLLNEREGGGGGGRGAIKSLGEKRKSGRISVTVAFLARV